MILNQRSTIKEWDEKERPREKLLLTGSSNLSDAELLAILIGSGSRFESAVELARRILASNDNSLLLLGKKSVNELIQFKGIGKAKAIAISAALELGRRRKSDTAKKQPAVQSSRDVFEIMHPLLSDLLYEEFWILLLNRSNLIIEKVKISQGGISGTVTDIRMILKSAILSSASSIILCHNHPSGNIRPSSSDVSITRKMKDSALMMDLKLLDHIIVTDKGYYSFADEGAL